MGRMPDSEVPLDAHKDLDVSGRHAEIVVQNSHWVVVDCGSRNGTFINDQRVGRQIVSVGDRIRLGEEGAVFTVEEASVDLGFAKTEATPSGIPLAAASIVAGEVSSSSSPATAAASPIEDAAPPPEHARWAPTPFALPDAATGPMTPADGQGSSAWGVAPSAVAPSAVSPSGVAPPAAPAQAPPHTPWQSPPHAETPPSPSPGVSPREPTMGEMTQAALAKREVPTALKAGVALLAVLFVLMSLVVGVAAFGSSTAPDAPRVAAANQEAILQLVGRASGQDAPFCNAFAVRPTLLATSARCVLEIEQRQRGGVFVEVVQGAQRYRLSRLWRHPDFDAATGAGDVGLVEVDRPLPLVVNLGGSADQVVALGFSPLGLVATPLSLQQEADFLRYDAALPSGAPLFDASGAVVGIHSAAMGWGEGSGQGTSVAALESLLAGLPE